MKWSTHANAFFIDLVIIYATYIIIEFLLGTGINA